MSIYKMEKIVLALLLAGCLSSAAWADGTRIVNPSGTTYSPDPITGTFSGLSDEDAQDDEKEGGAIHNEGTITSITGMITVTGTGDEQVITGTTSFTNNETTSDKGSTSKDDTGGKGGAIFNEGNIGTIDGVYFESNESRRGGAIYNGAVETSTDVYDTNTGTIGTISGSYFVGNKGDLYAGAIYNSHYGVINSIDGCYFLENESDAGNGGAVENAWEDSTIVSITGCYFEGNKSIIGTGAGGSGGAVYNEGTIGSTDGTTGGISDTQFIENDASFGGAIYNKAGATITSITSTSYTTDANGMLTSSSSIFSGNTASGGGGSSATGGAIDNAGTIKLIEYTIFDSNVVQSESSVESMGGAIYNSGTIEKISNSLFKANVATGHEGGYGGAIYNNGGTIDVITYTTFDSNDARGSEGNEQGEGGAICNWQYSTINEISNCTFKNNISLWAGAIRNFADSAYGAIGTLSNCIFEGNVSQYGVGGAIYNEGYIGVTPDSEITAGGIINCSFINNSATVLNPDNWFDGNAVGGAICNSWYAGIETITNTSFIGNYATSEYGGAYGGAIYSTDDLTIAADNGYTIFSGNYTIDYQEIRDDNAIYMAKKNDGKITFSLSNKGTITLADNIRGEEGYSVEITGDGTDTTFCLLNDIYDGDVSIGNTTLSTIDGEVHTYNDVYGDGTISGDFYRMKSFTLTDNINMVVDVDLANEKMDRISTEEYNVGSYTLTVTGMNLISDTEEDKVAVYFAETALMKNVGAGMDGLPDSNQLEAFTPVYEYDVYYVYKDDSGLHDEAGGTHTLTDSTLISSSDDDGGYFVFHKSGFNPAVMATSVAEAGAYYAFGMVFDYNFEHSDYYMKLPEDVRLTIAEDQKNAKKALKENDPTRSAYYNQHELTYRGAWTRSFFSNESVDYSGWSSRDKYYGAMVGFDTDMKVHDNGWASVFTGYAGTLGIRQEYSGGHIKQLGGFVGLTESFYKKNFYNAWTIAAGMTKAHEHTMYGKDKDRIDQYGIATRLGWNIKLDDEGKYSLLPTFTASYTYVHPEDFTNAGDVRITGSGFRAVQLNPNVKFIMNLKNGWQPYLTVGEVWTVAESTHLRANGTKLDELDFDPYTEYVIGVQKRWANERDAYVQVLGHSDGRDGILVNAGIRWNF